MQPTIGVGYHASHEQFTPSRLLNLCARAADAGFGAAKASDHFHPWSLRQGQSGATWAWLGAAMQACPLPFGTITAPGYRYHPAVIAQSAATLAEMFPGRFWLALGSGEAVNEAITGLPWPEKAERNARLAECAAIIRALLDGEEVTHRGRVTVIEAKLFTRPAQPVPLFGAAVSAETAAKVAAWADGLLTVGGKAADVQRVLTAFRENGGAGKPVHIQHALSWAPTLEEAQTEALHQWRHAVLAGEATWDLRRPQDFDRAADHASIDQLERRLPISDDLGRHAADIAALLALDATVHLHCVGRNQEAFIDSFASKVLPALGGD
jgi:coenzyme F420-dependent glucose-6-phosphate dehydrogenase